MSETKKKKEKGGPKRKSYVKNIAKVGVSDSLHHPSQADYTEIGDANYHDIAPSRFMHDGRWYTMSPKGDEKMEEKDGKLINQLGKEVKKEEKKEVKKEEKKEVKTEEKAPPKAESSPQAWTDYYKAAIKAGYKYAKNTQGKLFDLRNLGGSTPKGHSF